MLSILPSAVFALECMPYTDYTIPHLGDVKLVCDTCDAAPKLYLEVNATKWEGLASVFSGFDVSIPVPEGCLPFNHAFVSYTVGRAHPPWDGRQFNGEQPGGYGQPHVDVHFMIPTPEERESFAGCPVNDPGPANSNGVLIQCDLQTPNDEDAQTLKFLNLPPPTFTTGFVESSGFGGHAIVGHGNHLYPQSDVEPGGPAACESTGPSSTIGLGWLDCHRQFLNVALLNNPFEDLSCTCGFWEDGTTAVLNTYDGKVVGNEVMPTLGIVEKLRNDDLPNPYFEEYPQADKYDSSGHQPTSTMNELVGDVFRTGLVLSPEYTTANAGGDPITSFQGRETRYWLSMEHLTPVFEQGPFVLSQLAGPTNPPPGLESHKGAWVVATELNFAGLGKLHIETVDPTTLLAPPNATAPPATNALTTMRLSFAGKQLTAGEHQLSVLDLTTTVSAMIVPEKLIKIGCGFVERVDIKAQGLHLRITSSKANKFADEKLQVLGLHLDLEFLAFEQDTVRGALPEMWGLLPMSKETKLLLEKPADL